MSGSGQKIVAGATERGACERSEPILIMGRGNKEHCPAPAAKAACARGVEASRRWRVNVAEERTSQSVRMSENKEDCCKLRQKSTTMPLGSSTAVTRLDKYKALRTPPPRRRRETMPPPLVRAPEALARPTNSSRSRSMASASSARSPHPCRRSPSRAGAFLADPAP